MSPSVVHEPAALRGRCEAARAAGRAVGFVPTMGALHEGHLALAREARRRVGDQGIVVVSVFVNPTQFAPHEDLAKYPRELGADVARCATAGVDLVFAPAPAAMYPPGDQTRVRVPAVAAPLEGEIRPTHFEGVATVVTKLFLLVGPCVAVFGRKDYQQWRVLSRLAQDLFLPVEVVGLAMSSRNRYLSHAERARASAIPEALSAAARAWARGERGAATLRDEVEASLRGVVDAIEYVAVRDADDLGEVPAEIRTARALVAVAVRVGATRLIDNLVLGEDPAPVGA